MSVQHAHEISDGLESGIRKFFFEAVIKIHTEPMVD